MTRRQRLKKYLDQKDDLYAGRVPGAKQGALTITELVNRFLSAKVSDDSRLVAVADAIAHDAIADPESEVAEPFQTVERHITARCCEDRQMAQAERLHEDQRPELAASSADE